MFPTLKVSDHSTFDRPFPVYQQPTELGTFCLGEHRDFIFNTTIKPKYVVDALVHVKNYNRVHFDLNLGYDRVIKKDIVNTGNEKLDNLLKWIISSKNFDLSTNFVCYRGLLTTILCTPYENQDGWIICATKYRNVIYLCQFDTDHKRDREINATEREKLMSSWGYKFEQYLTCDSPDGKTITKEAVNENEEFCSVVKTKLNSHSIVLGAEMDGVDPSKQDLTSMNRYIELKTSRMITSQRQERNFQRYKLIKWWAQSFLIGIENIICGFRDDDGIVESLQVYNLRDIAKMTKGLWSAAICMNFCDQFLNHVKQCVQKDDPHIVYKFEWNPRDNDVKVQEMKSNSSFCFLPKWFIDEINAARDN